MIPLIQEIKVQILLTMEKEETHIKMEMIVLIKIKRL